MTKELYKNLKYKDLEKLEEVKAEINEESFKVVEGICPNCNLKMEKFIENKNLLDGAITFHIIKFRCEKCNKEFLDIEQAQKYDLYSLFEKFSKKPARNFGNIVNKLKVLVEV